ncbi:MAG: hypothetical protein U1F27_04420 [Turneriella sp.]
MVRYLFLSWLLSAMISCRSSREINGPDLYVSPGFLDADTIYLFAEAEGESPDSTLRQTIRVKQQIRYEAINKIRTQFLEICSNDVERYRPAIEQPDSSPAERGRQKTEIFARIEKSQALQIKFEQHLGAKYLISCRVSIVFQQAGLKKFCWYDEKMP